MSVCRGWSVDIPLRVAAGGMGARLIIGGIAGLYPAIRAACLAPAEALSAA
jgi:putative ABC transport system permease protein